MPIDISLSVRAIFLLLSYLAFTINGHQVQVARGTSQQGLRSVDAAASRLAELKLSVSTRHVEESIPLQALAMLLLSVQQAAAWQVTAASPTLLLEQDSMSRSASPAMKSHRVQALFSRSDMLAAGVALAASLHPAAASAKTGEFAKFSTEFTDSIELSSLGSGTEKDAVYQESGKQVTPKLKLITEQFTKMVDDVRKAMQRSTPGYAAAQSALSSNMNSLKSDMRLVGRILGGGEVSYAKNQFDYGSGKYKLAPVPAKAEAVISQVNYLFTMVDPATKLPAKQGLAALDKAEATFNEFAELVKQADATAK